MDIGEARGRLNGGKAARRKMRRLTRRWTEAGREAKKRNRACRNREFRKLRDELSFGLGVFFTVYTIEIYNAFIMLLLEKFAGGRGERGWVRIDPVSLRPIPISNFSLSIDFIEDRQFVKISNPFFRHVFLCRDWQRTDR